MKFSSASTILVTAHDGTRTRARCLPCSQRRDFLALWEAAWDKMRSSVLATNAMEQSEYKGVAYLWDSDEEFRGLCLEMLALHRIDGYQLDISQVTELLFRSEGGNGLLVELQFPPMPPGATANGDEGDPYHKLLAAMAFKTGDWAAAQAAMESIPYDDVVLLCDELEKSYKAAQGEKPKAPPPPSKPDDDDDFSKVEKIALADLQTRLRGGPDPMEAIKAAIQKRDSQPRQPQKPGADDSTDPSPDSE